MQRWRDTPTYLGPCQRRGDEMDFPTLDAYAMHEGMTFTYLTLEPLWTAPEVHAFMCQRWLNFGTNGVYPQTHFRHSASTAPVRHRT